MRKITQEELKTIVEKHQHWLHQDCDGWEAMRADLRSADLSDMDLSGMDLRGADLGSVCLCCTNLADANLSNANLSCADLRDTNLHSTALYDADLRGADLRCTDLIAADLRGADLKDAILHYAILDNAYLDDVKNMPDMPYTCPETGSFIGWKKARGRIVKLEIPDDALRSSATSEKCRCNKARVLGIETYDGAVAYEKKVASYYDRCFIYEVGKTVAVDNFDTNRWNECAPGIHFFMNRDDAVSY